ncbi:MAG: nitroreductase family deazaflavin-dependent oxidoreductase [Anaerolineales bacterium]|jgi:deazaflavin-dependent oxidoreductase (nitroreductase family)
MSVDLFSQIPIEEDQLRKIFKGFNRFMLLLWRLGLGSFGNGNRYAGWIMVIKHIGRKTGLTRYAPVNYAIVDGDVYCTAGFGSRADWYRNLMDNPEVEMWLPDGRWAGVAQDATDDPGAAELLRQVIIAAGFAGPLFGVNASKMQSAEFESLLGDYRLIRIRRTEAVTGPGGPGDLAWVWPLATFVLLARCLRRK